LDPRPTLNPDRLLDDLNPSQRQAATITSGPLAIIAGAGSGKTRVISRRAAYAIETGAIPPDQILLVTFTDKAAGEMVERMRALGHPNVMARTFHAAALAQLRHFWPMRHNGAALPGILESKLRLVAPMARRLPGGYSFTPARDLAETIEWAKVRRIRPEEWAAQGGQAPIPSELFARLYANYESAKAREGLIDFEDMLVLTVEMLETDGQAAATVRARKRWFSVDEYQDTTPLCERLLELWLGESRDLAVVGDPDQTIYTFTGATPEFLNGFAARHAGARVVTLAQNYRSTPQILALSNRLASDGIRGGLLATRPEGPVPTIHEYPSLDDEIAAVVAWVREVIAGSIDPSETAILVRMNAQLLPIEDALTRAGIAFTIRGQRFFDRREVREARSLLGRSKIADTGAALAAAIERLFVDRMGLGDVGDDAGAEGRERAASLELLVGIVEDLAAADPTLSLATVRDELDRRASLEEANSASGVNLLTYHKAKGLEWDAVYLPSLDEGILPIRQARTDQEVAEERRLLYVGITRARRILALSSSSRRPSRFLAALGSGQSARPARSAAPKRGRVTVLPGAPIAGAAERPDNSPLLEALRSWRLECAQTAGMPAYVVAHNTMLAEIADVRPRSLAALRRIRGMGPARLERYGAEILQIVADHA
jgi:DNA helicase-2/ATP-dependent DNA helicase PcrA